MDMKKRVHLELKDRSPAEVCVLALDTCRSGDGEVDGVTEEFSALEVLRMVNVGLKSLAKLPSLPKLHKKPLKKLKTLEVFGCEAGVRDDHRDAVFRLLPQITYLDGFDRHDEEAPDSDDGEPPPNGWRNGPGDNVFYVADDGAGPHDEDDDGNVSEEEEDEVGLSYLMKEGIQDEDDDGDYVEEDDEEEEEEDDEDGDEEAVRGDKRKRDDDDEDDEDEDDQ
nr:acidic leucine-rich nuclear phosphoprotein 32 family member E-like isoform X6 [Nerophis lumbriciformis]